MIQEICLRPKGRLAVVCNVPKSASTDLARLLSPYYAYIAPNMRASIRRLASSVTSQPLKLQEASASLLPPLPCVLSLHSRPNTATLISVFFHADFSVGSCGLIGYSRLRCAYWAMTTSSLVSLSSSAAFQPFNPSLIHPRRLDLHFTEFRRHRSTDNPLHIMGFLSEWKLYLDQLESAKGTEFRGKPLDPTLLESVSSLVSRTILTKIRC